MTGLEPGTVLVIVSGPASYYRQSGLPTECLILLESTAVKEQLKRLAAPKVVVMDRWLVKMIQSGTLWRHRGKERALLDSHTVR